ncbi:MAG: hypothetical protein MI922_26285, partial [Bacteroidales bacterium]|nr:hypothetical protein [Bacteroidales bacterium]
LDALEVEYGASHSELMVTEKGEIYIVEIAARMGGDNIGAYLVSLSTGCDFLKAVIDVSLGIPPKIEKSLQKYAGIQYITPPGGVVSSIENHASEYPYIVKSEVLSELGDTVEFPVKESGNRSAYFIYQSDKREQFNRNEVIKISTD